MVAVLIHHEVKSSAVLASRPYPECTTVNNWLPTKFVLSHAVNKFYLLYTYKFYVGLAPMYHTCMMGEYNGMVLIVSIRFFGMSQSE